MKNILFQVGFMLIRLSLPHVHREVKKHINAGFQRAKEWSVTNKHFEEIWVEEHIQEIVNKLLKAKER